MSSNPPWHFGRNQKNENTGADSAGGVADENLPAAAGDPGLIAGLAGFPLQGSSRARILHLLGPTCLESALRGKGSAAVRSRDRGEEHAPARRNYKAMSNKQGSAQP